MGTIFLEWLSEEHLSHASVFHCSLTVVKTVFKQVLSSEELDRSSSLLFFHSCSTLPVPEVQYSVGSGFDGHICMYKEGGP